jgi:hypothetical protein
MATALSRALTLAAMVIGVPAACGAGLLYGRALSEAQVSEGRLASPEEARARSAELRRRFLAMTPAEHLAEARRLLAIDYDARYGVGGQMDGAAEHLRAIPDAAPEHAAVAGILSDIDARRQRMSRLLPDIIDHETARPVPADDDARADARRALVNTLDRVGARFYGCIHNDSGEADEVCFDACACDLAMIDTLVPAAQRAKLRAWGFRRVRCLRGGAERPL